MSARALSAFAAILMLTVCAAGTANAADDPFEDINRSIFALNRVIRTHALAPAAEAYLEATTPEFRNGAAAALANLNEPVTTVSALAAGRLDIARISATRFLINSTFGIAGVADRASEEGYPRANFSPGDALCAWGVPSGPYLVLPLLGPSTVRDALGAAAAGAGLGVAAGAFAYGAASGLERLQAYVGAHDAIRRWEETSLDPYALHRSLYLQRRARDCATDAEAAAQPRTQDFLADQED
ncbi:MAG: MlaA family lipoprotein [Elsteraceae bacterium]